jgi:hypothetical protein
MGAWGVSTFESDAALDFVLDIVETNDLSLIESTIREVIAYDDELDADLAEQGLVAGEIIAALHGNSSDLPPELQDWIKSKESNSPELRHLAHKATKKVLDDSELRELWEESDEFDDWQGSVRDLLSRLSA